MAELLTLSSFAFSSPLLGAMGDQPVFLVARDVTGWRLALLAVLVLMVPALALLAGDVLVTSATGGSKLARAIFTGAFLAIILLQPVRKVTPSGTVTTLLLLAGLWGLGAWAYHRSALLKSALRIGALASLGFAGMFLFASPASALLEEFDPSADSESATNGASIVFLLFDQLPLSLLVDTDGQIDSVRFPNFARLAEASTWYRNAVTVSSQTALAVPALLTGRVPEPDSLPVVSQHPENLFTYLGDSHAVTAYETFTQLCPDAYCRGHDREVAGNLVDDLFVILTRSLVDEQTADYVVPRFGTTWAGFNQFDRLVVEDEATTMAEAHENRLRGDDRERVDRFMSDLIAADPPSLHYLHLEKPHEPLMFLPDGRRYDSCDCYSVEEGRWPDSPMTAQRLQRYLLQAMYTDTVLGRVLDALESGGQFEPTMLVVMSDHGAGLLPGMSNRDLTEDNAAEILPVPLFIKPPGQGTGQVDHRHVQLVDVLPTMLTTVGADPGVEMDGLALSGNIPDGRELQFVDNKRARKLDGWVTVDESELPNWVAELFPEAGNPYAFGPNADLYGVRVDQEPIGTSEITVDLATERVLSGAREDYVAAHVIGSVTGTDESAQIVVTVDDVVAGMGSTFADDGGWRLSIMVDPTLIRAESLVGVYEIRGEELLEITLR